jgi:hypothetical protein
MEDSNKWEKNMSRSLEWPQHMKALRWAQCKEEAERQGGYAVLVPTGWCDGPAGGVVLQPSERRGDGGSARGDSVRSVYSGPISCDLELPRQPGLVKVRGGKIHS